MNYDVLLKMMYRLVMFYFLFFLGGCSGGEDSMGDKQPVQDEVIISTESSTYFSDGMSLNQMQVVTPSALRLIRIGLSLLPLLIGVWRLRHLVKLARILFRFLSVKIPMRHFVLPPSRLKRVL